MNQSKFDTHSLTYIQKHIFYRYMQKQLFYQFSKVQVFIFVLKGDAIYFDPLYTKYVQQSFDIRNIFTYFHAISNLFNEVNIFF